jgi:hypothetical protein
MPNAVARPSLTTTLADRYETQPVGGAFDARDIVEVGVDALFASMQGSQFQVKNGFLTKEQQGISDFKNDGKDLSQYVAGLDTSKYDAAVH